MFGPVFRHELSAAARGSRLHGLRWLYGLLVLAQLLTFIPPARIGPNGVIHGWRFADLHAELLFWRIAVQQVALFLVCTPAFAAGAFTAEKVRGTLLPLFVTPLTSWQIVCDKFLARLAQLLLLSLTECRPWLQPRRCGRDKHRQCCGYDRRRWPLALVTAISCWLP
jgi:hypothetical protein